MSAAPDARQRERFLRVLAMTRSPVEEEARTAAMILARMLHEAPELANAPERWSAGALEMDAFARGYTAGRKAGLAESTQAAVWQREASERRHAVERTAAPVRLTSRYDGTCRACGVGYIEGDEILWARGRGATCVDCEGWWEERTGT